MDKYFSKALFYDETRKCVVASTLISAILMKEIIDFFTDKHEVVDKLGRLSDGVIFASFLMVCGIIANLYESYNNKDCKYGFMLTQPYKRDAIVVTKFLTTILSVTLPLLIYGVIVSFIYMSNTEGKLLKDLWGTILLTISMCFFIAAIIQLSNKLIGNTIVAIFMPMVLAIITPLVLGIILLVTPLALYRDNFAERIDPIITSTGRTLNLYPILVPIIFILISLVVVCLSILLNRRIAYEKTSDLFLFKFVEIFFAYFASIFISTVMVGISIVLVVKIFEITLNDNMYNFFVLSILDIVIISLTIVIKKLLYKVKRRMA